MQGEIAFVLGGNKLCVAYLLNPFAELVGG
jgi:hypothetical protein